jgi:hypothetical protein
MEGKHLFIAAFFTHFTHVRLKKRSHVRVEMKGEKVGKSDSLEDG